MPRLSRSAVLLSAALLGGAVTAAAAQETATPAPNAPGPSGEEGAPREPRPIRNAPSPRALEFAAYIFSAANVCGYQIGTAEFEALLAKQNVRAADVAPRGPFGNRVMGIFTLMSNQMTINREQSCLAVAGEYGPEGSVAKNVLLPAGAPPQGEKPAAGPQ